MECINMQTLLLLSWVWLTEAHQEWGGQEESELKVCVFLYTILKVGGIAVLKDPVPIRTPSGFQ
jgi:hypothetical protein